MLPLHLLLDIVKYQGSRNSKLLIGPVIFGHISRVYGVIFSRQVTSQYFPQPLLKNFQIAT